MKIILWFLRGNDGENQELWKTANICGHYVNGRKVDMKRLAGIKAMDPFSAQMKNDPDYKCKNREKGR